MRKLSQAQQELVNEAKAELREVGNLKISKDGSYTIYLEIVEGKYRRKDDTAEWQEITEEEAMQCIEDHADWLR